MPKISRRGGAPSEFRSGLEDQIAGQLASQRVAYAYEKLIIPYTRKTSSYKPDFVVTSNGIIIETKGQFVTADRSKMKLVKEQHPDLDIRLVFSNSRSRIGKKSTTSYAAWCDSHGFPYADKYIPLAWLREAPNEASLRAIERLMLRSKKK